MYFVVYLHKVLNQTSAIFVKNVFIILLELSKVYDLVGFNGTAPGKFVIEDGCIMKYHSSQVKNAFFLQKSIFSQLSHICHIWLLSVLQIYFVDIHNCVYSNYKESLIMSMLMMFSLLLLLLLLLLVTTWLQW